MGLTIPSSLIQKMVHSYRTIHYISIVLIPVVPPVAYHCQQYPITDYSIINVYQCLVCIAMYIYHQCLYFDINCWIVISVVVSLEIGLLSCWYWMVDSIQWISLLPIVSRLLVLVCDSKFQALWQHHVVCYYHRAAELESCWFWVLLLVQDIIPMNKHQHKSRRGMICPWQRVLFVHHRGCLLSLFLLERTPHHRHPL